MDLPTGLTVKDLVRYAKLSSQATKTTKLRNALNDKIKKSFAGKIGTEFKFGQDYVFGNASLQFGKQMVFDAKAFAKKYPADKFPQYYTLQVDATKIPDDLKTDKVKTQRITLDVSEVEVITATAEINVEQQAAA